MAGNMRAQAAVVSNAHVSSENAAAISSGSLFVRAWPAAMIATALLINGVWVALLGYGLFRVVTFAVETGGH
jgi:hypothetical protein